MVLLLESDAVEVVSIRYTCIRRNNSVIFTQELGTGTNKTSRPTYLCHVCFLPRDALCGSAVLCYGYFVNQPIWVIVKCDQKLTNLASLIIHTRQTRNITEKLKLKKKRCAAQNP